MDLARLVSHLVPDQGELVSEQEGLVSDQEDSARIVSLLVHDQEKLVSDQDVLVPDQGGLVSDLTGTHLVGGHHHQVHVVLVYERGQPDQAHD